METLSSILINQNSSQYQIDEGKIQRLVEAICCSLGFKAYEVSISFVSLEEIRGVNKKFRNKDAATDVLSFPQNEWKSPVLVDASVEVGQLILASMPGPVILGDLLISLDEALANAANIGQSLGREVAFLLIHGILHLCGHDHMEVEEEKVMLRQQEIILKTMFELGLEPIMLSCVQEVRNT